MGLILFILIVPIAVAAWTVLFLCWKGRQVPQPATCAACGHATGDQPGMLASTCAECGSDLTVPRAVRYFRRERTALMRAGLVVATLLLCISSLVPLAGLVALFIGLGPRMVRPAAPPPVAPVPAPATAADDSTNDDPDETSRDATSQDGTSQYETSQEEGAR